MLILGIETSCDETALAIVEGRQGKLRVLKNVVASQIKIHQKYGGVIPEVAARQHAEIIAPLLKKTLGRKKPDVIAVTAGPGLAIALLVGIEVGRTLSYLWEKPLVKVNHLAGHIYANWLIGRTEIRFPILCLVVSGGHTELVLMTDHLKYKVLGRTRDDAAGECFDKVAKILGLPYPGGPPISRLARLGNQKKIAFPRPMLSEDNFDFSFSGLKTAVLYYVKGHASADLSAALRQDICASFEQAVVDVLVSKTLRAAKKYRVKTVMLGGGVAANHHLRSALAKAVRDDSPNTKYQIPDTKYTTDNAAMIAAAGYFQTLKKDFTDWRELEINPQMKLA